MSPITTVNPQFGAMHVAKMLDDDPVMARLVKEHLTPARILELLELPDDSDQVSEEMTITEALEGFGEKAMTEWALSWLSGHPA